MAFYKGKEIKRDICVLSVGKEGEERTYRVSILVQIIGISHEHVSILYGRKPLNSQVGNSHVNMSIPSPFTASKEDSSTFCLQGKEEKEEERNGARNTRRKRMKMGRR